MGARQNFRRVHDALYAAAEDRARQHAQRRDEAEAARLAACTFRPSLNERRLPAEGRALRMTEALIATGIPDIDAYEQLRASVDASLFDEQAHAAKGGSPRTDAPARPSSRSPGAVTHEGSRGGQGGLSAAEVDREVERVLGRLLGGGTADTVWAQDNEGDVVVCFGSPAAIEVTSTDEGTGVQ